MGKVVKQQIIIRSFKNASEIKKRCISQEMLDIIIYTFHYLLLFLFKNILIVFSLTEDLAPTSTARIVLSLLPLLVFLQVQLSCSRISFLECGGENDRLSLLNVSIEAAAAAEPARGRYRSVVILAH